MKNLLIFILFLGYTAVQAQEDDVTAKIESRVSQNESKKTDKNSKANQLTHEDVVCYSEKSKISFYEALIATQKFDIKLKDSQTVVVKNTEQKISEKMDQILYSEE